MKYSITSETIGNGYDSVVGGTNFEGTLEEAQEVQHQREGFWLRCQSPFPALRRRRAPLGGETHPHRQQ